MKFSMQDYRLGAVYRIGVQRSFDGETLARLLIERAGLADKPAHQLAAHWLTSEPMRLGKSFPKSGKKFLEGNFHPKQGNLFPEVAA